MNKLVLIADDELHIRLLIEQSLEDLEDEGVELQLVADGEQAASAVRTRRPDVLLLDVMMPKKNGFDLCREIKSDPELSGIFTVLLTAKGQENDRRQGEAAGADLYLTKPFNPDDLLSLVRDTLGLGSSS